MSINANKLLDGIFEKLLYSIVF